MTVLEIYDPPNYDYNLTLLFALSSMKKCSNRE